MQAPTARNCLSAGFSSVHFLRSFLAVSYTHLDFRGQHTLHSVGNIVDGIVNDAVHTHFHAGLLGLGLGNGIGADVEADDNGVGSIGQREDVYKRQGHAG